VLQWELKDDDDDGDDDDEYLKELEYQYGNFELEFMMSRGIACSMAS
jgi:hypothetical protein